MSKSYSIIPISGFYKYAIRIEMNILCSVLLVILGIVGLIVGGAAFGDIGIASIIGGSAALLSGIWGQRHVACLGPEPVERSLGQRLVPALAGGHPLPRSRLGEGVQQRPRRCAARQPAPA